MDLADPLHQQADARLHKPLAFLCRMVLGVLTQVTQLARTLDLLRQLRLQLLVQLADLVFKLLQQSGLHSGNGNTGTPEIRGRVA